MSWWLLNSVVIRYLFTWFYCMLCWLFILASFFVMVLLLCSLVWLFWRLRRVILLWSGTLVFECLLLLIGDCLCINSIAVLC